MKTTITKAALHILSSDTYENSAVYQGIMELMARFDYLSIQEVMYANGLDLMKAVHRLDYLENRAGMIKRFASGSLPKDFFCLSANGRQAVRDFHLSDEVSDFIPSHFAPAFQAHRRMILKVYVAMKDIFGDRLLNWVSERQLQAQEEYKNKQEKATHKRILDGECTLKVQKKRYVRGPAGDVQALWEDPVLEDWRTGIEVELTAKSPKRYEQQFDELARRVYDSWVEKLYYPQMIFLYGTRTIRDHLARQLIGSQHNFGTCMFYLGQVDEFLGKRGQATMERVVPYIARSEGAEAAIKTITARDMGTVSIISQGANNDTH